jgi:gliding motility-associated-like protein
MRLLDNFIRYKFFLTLLCVFYISTAHADHLKGGWIKYTFVSKADGFISYTISFYQYSDCSEPEKVDATIFLGVFDAGSNSVYRTIPVSLTRQHNEVKNNFGPCFQNPPTICYIIAEYTTTIRVPENTDGYILTAQRCCRIAGIANVPSSNAYGLTYTLTIPGGANSNDNSPEFDFRDTVAICYNEPFTIDLGATDKDGDSLRYTLCNGLTGGTQIMPVVDHPSLPPYASVPYSSVYSGAFPLGANASLDPATGIFSGTAPAQIGTYVVAVCVDEFRNGVYIGHTRKEIHLDVENCRLGGANLKPSYITCDGYDFTFIDETENPGYSYFWDFGVTNIATDTSSKQRPTYTYKDTGDYIVKLSVHNNEGCTDSTTAHVKIYPGFVTDFSVTGSCIKNPYSFKDLTTTKYGVVDSWRWAFDTDGSDTIQNPDFLFPDTGAKAITLISTNSKGCADTITKPLNVDLGPDAAIKFKDTLICSIDTLQLQSSSSTAGARFSWQPGYNISNSNVSSPFVSPKQTTIYNLTVSYKGCETVDSVTVNVIDRVDLSLPPDTTICKTDSVQLTPSTNALYFSWLPAQGLDNTTAKNPVAVPLVNTTYSVIGSVGKCFAQSSQTIRVAPYPVSNAGEDVVICYGKTAQLNAVIDGENFTWSPTNSLINVNTLTPVAGPAETTSYILRVTNNSGCLKPVNDTVVVNVIPKVNAFAGNDTSVVIHQPLQLNATGGEFYEWSPPMYLNNAFISNPVATFPSGLDTMVYHVKVSTEQGCLSTDSIKIYLFETNPSIFIPTAFTPNGDGLNDVLRPTLAGMQKFNYFNVYNRWGQLLFNTSQQGIGWNGMYNGKKQSSGTYIYTASAVDFTGKNYFIKGSFVLIR